MQNKKLTNASSRANDDDRMTKKGIENYVTRQKMPTADFTPYLKRDGSVSMTGLLNMDNSRIENVVPGRHNTTDTLTHLQLEAFYFNLNVDDGKIKAENPIDMGNKKITGLKEPLYHSDAATKFYIHNSMVSKADKTQLND